jgi:primosomal protein N' (replication factor Y)
LYANVVVDTDAPGLDQAFTYRVPEELVKDIFAGACVSVPFGGREVVGYVVDLTDHAPNISGIKYVSAVVSEACSLNSGLISLASWISDYYAAPLAHSMRAIVPEVMSATVSTNVVLIAPDNVHAASPAQQRLVQTLQTMGGEADSETLKMKSGIDKYAPTLRALRNRGAIEIIRTLELPKVRPLIVQGLQLSDIDDLPIDAMLGKAPKQSAILKELAKSTGPIRRSELLKSLGTTSSPAKALVDKGLAENVDMRIRRKPFASREVAKAPEYTLTRGQEDALEIIREGFEQDAPQTTLLYGVTGSGKTEVYLRAIADVLADGGSAISLCPEISLTTHLMDAYRSRFGDLVAILHSRLSPGERHDEWHRIETGEATVVLGPRSAVFAPVRNLKLVVVDEEHEPTYKQDHSPRYSARLAAEERARSEGASVILGSATPSVDTFYRASSSEIRLAVIDKRVEDRPLPTVEIVDMREEFTHGQPTVFSKLLHDGIEERLARGEQTILFVNRRGYASFLLCRTCGYTPKCENCDVSLTFHAADHSLMCHHCGESMQAPDLCPTCKGPHFRPFGIGTERVEEEVRGVFPEARVIRMDSDTTTKKGAHAKLLDVFRSGAADILVGTQMVAKGLDFPNVTLVGVISADTALNLPDFRASERTFQLLTQVSGRAGRGVTPGEVVIQTFEPEHEAIRAAARQDYLAFYALEIARRKERDYPPFSRLINVVSSDPVDGYAEERIIDFTAKLRAVIPGDRVQLMGPAPAPISRLRGLYRWHLAVKDLGADGLQHVIRKLIEAMPRMAGARLTVDVDPLTML